MLFPPRLLALSAACARENTRYAMTGVLFERDGSGACRAVATDSKMLVVADFTEPPDCETTSRKLRTPHEATLDFRQMVPGRTLAALAGLLAANPSRKETTCPHVALREPDESHQFRLTAELDCGIVAIEGPCDEGRFPPWGEILSEPASNTMGAMAFRPELLEQLVGG
jgi:hypothetical protein